jgi:hypothetical protein
MSVDKHGATQTLPLALRCTATAFGEVRIKIESEIQNVAADRKLSHF